MRFNTYKLSDLATIKYGKNQKKVLCENGTVPIYGTGGLMGYASDYLYDKPSVLIGRKGSIDKVRYVEHPFWTVDTLFYTEVNDTFVIPKFLFYSLSLIDFLQLNEGTTIPSLRTETLNRLELRIPELSDQRKILSVLNIIDDKIGLNNRINENLLQQAQTILTAFFVDFSHFGGEVPSDWELGSLQDIVDFSNGYAFKSKELLDAPAQDCYHVFKQGHINRGGGFNSSGTKSWYPISKCASLSKYILRKGDVLMAMTDMKDNVAILGNTALMTVDNQYIVNQRVGLLRSNGYRSTSYAYIYLLTNSFDFLKDLRSRANSGVQVNLSSTEIKASPVWIATDEVNKEFNSLTEPLLSMIMANDIENQKLANLRDTLLPRLVSGEIDVSELDI